MCITPVVQHLTVTVTTVELGVSSADVANSTFFKNITFDLKHKSSSDEDDKEKAKPVSFQMHI